MASTFHIHTQSGGCHTVTERFDPPQGHTLEQTFFVNCSHERGFDCTCRAFETYGTCEHLEMVAVHLEEQERATAAECAEIDWNDDIAQDDDDDDCIDDLAGLEWFPRGYFSRGVWAC